LNIFAIKIFSLHIVTLITITLTFLITYRKLKTKLIYKLTIAGIVVSLGVWFYDFVWTLLLHNWRCNIPRLIIVIFFVQILLVFNFFLKLHFLKFNVLFPILMTLFLLIICYMDVSGWFTQFRAWGANLSLPDPHNWLWALSKVIGIMMWISVIKNE